MNKSGAAPLCLLPGLACLCRKPREVTLLPCHPLEERIGTMSCVTIDFNAHAHGLTDVYRTLSMSVARRTVFCSCVCDFEGCSVTHQQITPLILPSHCVTCNKPLTRAKAISHLPSHTNTSTHLTQLLLRCYCSAL